jgi:hypothetical protein
MNWLNPEHERNSMEQLLLYEAWLRRRDLPTMPKRDYQALKLNVVSMRADSILKGIYVQEEASRRFQTPGSFKHAPSPRANG